MPAGRWLLLGTLIAIGTLLLGLPAGTQQAEEWDVTQPRGQVREIDFITSEGTWMSVDLSPDGRWIAFDLLGHIYRLPATGGEAQCLTQDSGIALNFHPRYSPDGRTIAFVSDRKGQNNLWLMDADGSNPRPVHLDPEARVTEPDWTPDGRHIVAVRNVPTVLSMWRRSARLWMFPREGGAGVELLGSATTQYYWPAVSPDGRYVYFHTSSRPRTQDGVQEGHRLGRLEIITGRVEDVTEPKGPLWYRTHEIREIAPEISPDGRWLAFARRVPGGTLVYRGHRYGPRTALWLRDLATGAERILVDPVTSDMTEAHGMKNLRVLPGYSWARDAKSLVFSQGGQLRRVWIETGQVETIPFTARVRRTISQAARARQRITDDSFPVRFVQWPTASPDGRQLVFAAVGALWLMDLPSGTPRPLTPEPRAGFEMTPAWSPDGRWVAYVTWDDSERGHVWKVPAAGGQPERLTREPGEYLHPAWSPDGGSLVVTRGAGATARGQFWEANLYYEIVRLPATGGLAEVLVRTGAPGSSVMVVRQVAKASFGPEGRVYFPELREAAGDVRIAVGQGQAGPTSVVALVSVGAQGGERREHLTVPYSDDIVVSPDGRWVAYHEGEHIWLAPFPQGTGSVLYVDKREGKLPVRRLSQEAGLYPRWRDARRVEFVSGNRYFVYDVVADQLDTVTIELKVPRDVPRRGIALHGARLITLDQRRVIERGTLVVAGGRIVCIGACDTTRVDQVIDVTGATIIPGLVDVHAHYLDGTGVLPQRHPDAARYLAYGVTTTLDPAGWEQVAFPLAELVEAGKVVGPRVFTTGFILRHWGDRDEIHSYDDAERNVRRLAAWGGISLKDFLLPRRQQRQWLAEAARRHGLSLTAEGADLFYNLSLVMDGHTGWEHPMMYVPLYSDAAKFFGQAGAVYSPTLVVAGPGPWALEYFLGRSDFWNDPKARRLVPWRELLRTRNYTERPLAEYSFPIIAEGVADVVRAGGHAAIGGHGELKGIDSNWEVSIYASALTPMEALEVASRGGAYMVGLENELGSLSVGKLADLVVLNSNPLENIRATLDIRYVMKGGKLYDGATLDQLWPERRPYGPYPWHHPDGMRTDERPEEQRERPR